jgi:RP/EB family microtubule-associated protein
MSTIGMMDGAFFVGRKEIIDWINTTLRLNLAKIEDTSNGAVACQLLDIMHPGQVITIFIIIIVFLFNYY